MNKNTRVPKSKSEITINLMDHETLLSFDDEDIAESFCTWWYERGEKLFMEYLNFLEQ